MGTNYCDLPPHIKKLVAQAGYTKGQAPTQVKKKGIPNELEKRFYQDCLANRELVGEISDVEYEPEAYPLAHKCTYTPDYRARAKDGALHVWEVKAPHRFKEKGMLKAKFFATKYPNITLWHAELKKGEWVIRQIPAMVQRTPGIPEYPEEELE